MNQKIKKRIAKEVLIAFSIVGFLLFIFIGVIFYNSIQGTKAVKIREKAYKVEIQIDSIKTELNNTNDLKILELIESLSDKKELLMEEHYKKHYSKLGYDEYGDFVWMIAFILIVITYPIRGLYLLIRWAINTLKE